MASFLQNFLSFFKSPRLTDRIVRTLNTFFVSVLSPVLYGGFGNINIDIETFPNPNYFGYV